MSEYLCKECGVTIEAPTWGNVERMDCPSCGSPMKFKATEIDK